MLPMAEICADKIYGKQTGWAVQWKLGKPWQLFDNLFDDQLYEIAFQTIDAPDYEREGKSCALVSDKQLFIKAVFTQDSIEDYCRFEYLNFSVA